MSEHHPADREILPDDPMEIKAVAIPGDVDMMFRLLVEEYARMGHDTDDILRLARNPFYAGFHRFYLAYGEGELGKRIGDVLQRCGVVRVREVAETPERIDEEGDTQCRT